MKHSRTSKNYTIPPSIGNPIGSPYADHIKLAVGQGRATINLAELRQLRVVEGGER